jgi:hypothetical protein
MTDLDVLWLHVLEELGDKAAHEIKDTLNGVSLNLEVVRSRAADATSVSEFAATAASQLDLVTARVSAMLALSRRSREPGDVGDVLRQLSAVLVPAARSEGGDLKVEGLGASRPTRASGQATRLALAAGLLALLRKGGEALCVLDGQRADTDGDTVVRISHESAAACSIDPEIVSAIAQHDIRIERHDGGRELRLVFPAFP